MSLAAPVARGEERPNTSADIPGLTNVRRLREIRLSPDGKHVAWVETLHAKDGETSPPSAIFVADLGTKPGKATRLTGGNEPCKKVNEPVPPDAVMDTWQRLAEFMVVRLGSIPSGRGIFFQIRWRSPDSAFSSEKDDNHLPGR